jgi:hypothetical protein
MTHQNVCTERRIVLLFIWGGKALQDKAMQRRTSTNQRDAPGQDTGRLQGHLSSYLLGGTPGERCSGIVRGRHARTMGLHLGS